jgi:hypothetical protein
MGNPLCKVWYVDDVLGEEKRGFVNDHEETAFL